ncbi:hypothetical protein EST38_g512 [Candolleomyces aberdarensis]|uniref:Aminotransferase class I/classII large domain-containing protein n=1 Tax=Candolleomyces aberdarensis TaxID=2316362 RepID=A0A4Q2DXT9_9AGAR|nr:hypothetical protein EST38_g512 [Candolleomyces aberdarensis]
MEKGNVASTSSGSGVLSDEYYLSRLSAVSKARKPSPIWDLFSVEAQPGMLSMLAGKPNPSTFPFTHITLGVKATPTANGHCSDLTATTDLVLKDDDLAMALQYNMTAGIPDLVKWVTDLMETVHCTSDEASAEQKWRVSLGPGSQDLLYKAFCALLNPGDTIIVEGPTYPTIIPLLDAMGCHYAIVDSDDEGMSASDLEKILSTWDSTANGKPFPKVLYTVPFGSNPAGITTSYTRRLEILQLARKHDLIIIEDDPYYFLYYGDAPKPPSYFALDRQHQYQHQQPENRQGTGSACPPSSPGELGGRVVRLDSFSKIISAGFRLGWVTGPSIIVTAIERHNASTVVQPSSLSQMVLLKLLQTWGLKGFLDHADKTASFYRERRDVLKSLLERYLRLDPHHENGGGVGLAEWKVPDASMFFWVKLNLGLPTSEFDAGTSPIGVEGGKEGEGDSTPFIRDTAVPRGVLVLPGKAAFPDGRETHHVRLSFSLLSNDEMEEAVKRLAGAIVEQQHARKLPQVEGEHKTQSGCVEYQEQEKQVDDEVIVELAFPAEWDELWRTEGRTWF